jgi:hypothetical protein
MPLIGFGGLHIIIALFFAVHAVRGNQNMYWLLILFMFPLLGSAVYFFAIYLPDMRTSRHARAAGRAVTRLIDPGRAVRQAQDALDLAPTMQNQLRLGQALLQAGQAQEALGHFEQAASGPFARDPELLLDLARARLATGQPAQAEAALQTLFADHPDERRQSAPALLHAQALAAAASPQTREAFEQALVCADNAAARCLYGQWLQAQGNDPDRQRAQALFADILNDARHWPRHTREHNREWLQLARQLAGGR